jgi:hypothetical protein
MGAVSGMMMCLLVLVPLSIVPVYVWTAGSELR